MFVENDLYLKENKVDWLERLKKEEQSKEPAKTQTDTKDNYLKIGEKDYDNRWFL